MRMVALKDYQNSLKLTHLCRTGRAKPVGPSVDNLQWVRTWGGKVIYIGLVLKGDVRL